MVNNRHGIIILTFIFLTGFCNLSWAHLYTLSSEHGNLVLNQYDESTGSFIKTLDTPPYAYANSIFSGEGDWLYTVTQDPGPGGAITKYNGITGELDAYLTPEIWGPGIDTQFGPDGNIYSRGNYSRYNFPSGPSTAFIHKLDGVTGYPIQEQFVSYLESAMGYFDFGPDGNIYVGNDMEILRFSGINGEFMGVFTFGGAQYLTFGPDEDIYGVCNGQIVRYDGTTGAPIGVFAETSGYFQFGPDGNLYVADETTRILSKYDGQTGEHLKDLFSFEAVDHTGVPFLFTFAGGQVVPEPVSSLLMVIGAAVMVFRRRLS